MSREDVDNAVFPVEAESCHVASSKNLPAKEKQIIEAAELNLEWNLNPFKLLLTKEETISWLWPAGCQQYRRHRRLNGPS